MTGPRMGDRVRNGTLVVSKIDREAGVVHFEQVHPQAVSFTVPGSPKSWKRAGQRGRQKWNPNAGEQQRIAWAAMAAVAEARWHPGPWPTDARYEVHIHALYPQRRKADLDNVAKMVCDALSRVLYADDSQVDRLTVTRHIDRDNPRVEVTVTVIG